MNEESEIRIKTDAIKEKCHTTRDEIKGEIQYLTSVVQKVYDAEQEFKEHITQIGVENGIYDEDGNAIVPGQPKKPQVAKGPAPIKTLAFGKIHTKPAGAK